MQVRGDALVNKLILLFVFDKMEAPLSENTILDMCCSANNWISYMDCKPLLGTLLDHLQHLPSGRKSSLQHYARRPGLPCGLLCSDSVFAPRRDFCFCQKQSHEIPQKSAMRRGLFYE